jgi:hypothetical protein
MRAPTILQDTLVAVVVVVLWLGVEVALAVVTGLRWIGLAHREAPRSVPGRSPTAARTVPTS